MFSGYLKEDSQTNYSTRGRNLERFDVVEDDADDIIRKKDIPQNLKLRVVIGSVKLVDHATRRVVFCDLTDVQQRTDLRFDVLAICIGSRPQQLSVKGLTDKSCIEVNKRILVIRDTHTVKELAVKLADCKE